MPELPEVETVARSLRPLLVGRTIVAASAGPQRLRLPLDLAALQALRGQPITAVERLGKYLLFKVGAPATPAAVLLSHLGMTGRYMVTEAETSAAAHTHVRIDLEGPEGRRQLRYVDPRRFGLLAVRPAEAAAIPELQGLGPDPLSDDFTVAHLATALRSTERPLKAALLDQGLVAGLGNIYVAEALFRASLSPTRRGSQVTRPQAQRLHEAIREILQAAISRRGTTLSDGGYVDAEGKQGDNQGYLWVYGREGEPCRRCRSVVRRVVQAQRSTFYCARCQR